MQEPDAVFAQPLYNSNHLGWPTMTAPAEPAVYSGYSRHPVSCVSMNGMITSGRLEWKDNRRFQALRAGPFSTWQSGMWVPRYLARSLCFGGGNQEGGRKERREKWEGGQSCQSYALQDGGGDSIAKSRKS